jgi:all-trans-retinol 13,14-reductase
MGEGMMGRRLFDFITENRVKWNPMPDTYDVFVYPNLQVRACKGEANFRRTLIEAFPNERSNIEQYFRDLKSAISWTNRYLMAMVTPVLLGRSIRAVNRLTHDPSQEVTRQYLERRFHDPQLRAVVTSQWANYGLPPGRSAFATHAVIASHYLNGAWYQAGGAGEIAKATGAVIRRAGGELLPNHDVTRILLEGDRAVGVEVNIRKGKEGSRAEIRAPVVVSDTGAWNTFTRMLPASALETYLCSTMFNGIRRDTTTADLVNVNAIKNGDISIESSAGLRGRKPSLPPQRPLLL